MGARLGAFVVFGDGAEKLRRCLASIQGVADEIVAVDTGAKDGAREVAEGFGARLFDLEWPDAFDEAYNFAMSKVESEWTLWLDSDEWLLSESEPTLRSAIEDSKAFAYYLVRRDFWEADRFTEMRMLRLWRTHPSLRLRGAIHAQFPQSALAAAARGRRIGNLNVYFAHDGFLGGISQEKLERNVEYLERELERRPGQLYFEIALAETYCDLGDPKGDAMLERLIERTLRDLRAARSVEPQVANLLALYFDRSSPEEARSPRMSQALSFAQSWFQRNAGLLWSMSSAAMKRGDPRAALDVLLRIQYLADTGTYDRDVSFPPAILAEDLWHNIAHVAELLGESGIAEQAKARLNAATPQ